MTVTPADRECENYALAESARNARLGLVVARRRGEHGALAMLADRLAIKDV